MAYFYSPRANGGGHRDKARFSPLLPHSSAIQEKEGRYGHQSTFSWLSFSYIRVPGMRNRAVRVPVVHFGRIRQSSVSRFGHRRGNALVCFGLLVLVWMVLSLTRRWKTHSDNGSWTPPWQDPPSLVYRRDDLQRIWQWEIASGHYPSSRKIPEQIGLLTAPFNPSLPPSKKQVTPPPGIAPSSSLVRVNTIGKGPNRVYLDIQAQPPNNAYPPRPVPNSIADLDVIMDHCDFTYNKYVRDCLEILRLGGGLDNQNRLRRGKMDDWKYIYVEEGDVDRSVSFTVDPARPTRIGGRIKLDTKEKEEGLEHNWNVEWETHLNLSAPLTYRPASTLPGVCDEEHPRLYHMFWAGPFTDKPYLALLSFLFTQNLGLHLSTGESLPGVCRPKFLLWINPGPAASRPNPNALRDMFDDLKSNPWASPFLHPRFKDVIQFKLWNTTEQLDGIPEIKEEWRAYQDSLFNSGGHIIKVKNEETTTSTRSAAAAADEDEDIEDDFDDAEVPHNATAPLGPSPTNKADNADDNDMTKRLGSKSSSTYDRMSVILSDMARFVLTHRFGGTYLDADTILLRDWEELWGWKGAFAYRWSRLEKYNTAVLRMNKDSALGTFLFRTALKNGLDFHPMTVSRYMDDAFTLGLLLRLPDALFDSAWLNTEKYQRDRPPQPYFTAFEDFFNTPVQDSAAPQALGFDGFFKGAYSYHFHNFWWQPFDPSRNFPDLGPRFIQGERQARASLRAESSSSSSSYSSSALNNRGSHASSGESDLDDEWWGEALVSDDKRDLDWATVLKRTFEGYIRGERPNMYGEWMNWE